MEKVINQKNPQNSQNPKNPRAHGGQLSDFVLKILAVVIAVIIWFALSITQYPTVNKTIINVPVDFSMSGTTAESKGLSALSYKDISVDVEIQGMNYEIGTYTANDLVATVNLDSVTKEGTYELEIDVKSAHSTDKCTVISVSPETVEVKFDHIDSKNVTVGASAPNIRAEEGYTLKETSVSPGEIEVQGAENELERLDKIVAVYSDERTLSEDLTVSSDSLLFYDADDNLLNSSNYTLSTKKVDITFVVYRKITADLAVDFTNVPPGFDTSSLPVSVSPEKLQIITPQYDASSTETIKLSSISMYDLEPRKTFKFAIDSLLGKGEVNQTGGEQIEVSFDFSDYTQKTFEISADDITFINKPAGKDVQIDNEKIVGVTIFGPSSSIEKLKASDLKATVDLSDVTSNGSISHEVVIYSESYSDVWNIGTHEAVINVSEQTSTSSSDT